jgi:hypothetical protein
MTVRTHATPAAYKTALEARVAAEAKRRGLPINRVRQLFVTERLLVRIMAHFGERVVAKGGLVLELRLNRARTTKDLDLRLTGDAKELLAQVRAACAIATGDLLEYTVEPDDDHPTIEGDGIVYEGFRFVARAMLAGRPYGGAFGVDIGVGDVLTEPPDLIEGSSLLSFVGVATPTLRLYPRGAHVAEKLHAYTLPRERPNSRVKDLPDLALLAGSGPFDGPRLRAAIEATFGFRKTHDLPPSLPPPPAAWTERYAVMARDDGLPWTTLEQVYAAARALVDPLLAGHAGQWDHVAGRWS